MPQPTLHALRRAGRDANEFCDKLLEAQPQGVCAYHAASGRCVLANQRALAIIGGTMEQVLAQDFRSLGTWKRDGFLAAAERVLATGTAEYAESLGPSSRGKEAQIQVHFSRFQSRGEWHLLALLTDISGRNRISRALQESLNSMKAILDAAPEIAFLMTPEGELIAANEKLARRLGHPVGELLGRSIYDFIPPMLGLKWKLFAKQAAVTQRPVSFEHTGLGLVRQNRIVPVAGPERRVIRLAVFTTDITTFRRVEADLEIQRDLHSALRESNEALLRGGDREALCRGVCAAAVGSGRFNLAWVGRHDDQGRLAVRAAAGPGTPVLAELDGAGAVPARLAAADASIRANRSVVDKDLAAHGLVSTAAMPVREAGRCVGSLNLYATEPGFFTDERMTLLENLATNLSHAMDLRSAQERAEAAGEAEHRREELLRNLEGLKAKSQIAAYIAHEINNPLAGIKQSFQVLAQAIPDGHPDRPFVGIIARELDRIAGIVRMAYSIHRPGLPQVRDCRVGETLADLATLLSSRLRPKRLVLELPDSGQALKGRLHEDILRQILFNVLQNAIEASPEGGRIRCRSWRDGGELVVEVEDQGPGVAPDIGARLFEPGFTTKSAPETGGLGMGLATCRSILQSVGGSISFRNLAPAPGACFFLRLPWLDDAAGGAPPGGHHE